MSETMSLPPNDLLLKAFRFSEQHEQAAEIKGEWDGKPFLIIVAVGAQAGLLERYARKGVLRLTPESLAP